MADLITSTRAKQSINQTTFTSAEDTQIASLVSAASLAIERLCRRTFASTAYDEYLDGNPCDRDSYHLQAPDQFLVLSNYPIVSITSVSIDGTVLASTEYTSLGSKGMLRRETGWPEGYRKYRVQYTAGYATVPEDIQEACAQWVSALFWQTKDNTASYPFLPPASVYALIEPFITTTRGR